MTETDPNNKDNLDYSKYEDFELGFKLAYPISSENAPEVELLDEIKNRNLSEAQLAAIVKEKLDEEIVDHDCKICPRCTSTHIKTIKEEFHGNNKAFGLDSGKPLTFITYRVCEICGWNFSVDETKAEKKDRITKALISLLASLIITLLLTYLVIRFGGVVD